MTTNEVKKLNYRASFLVKVRKFALKYLNYLIGYEAQ